MLTSKKSWNNLFRCKKISYQNETKFFWAHLQFGRKWQWMYRKFARQNGELNNSWLGILWKISKNRQIFPGCYKSFTDLKKLSHKFINVAKMMMFASANAPLSFSPHIIFLDSEFIFAKKHAPFYNFSSTFFLLQKYYCRYEFGLRK